MRYIEDERTNWNKKQRLFRTIIVVGVLCFLLESSLVSASNTEEKVRVFAILDSETNIFWENVWNGLRKEADKADVILTEYPYESSEEEILVPMFLEICDYAEADAVVLSIHKKEVWEQCEDLLEKIYKKGVEIIVIDTQPEVEYYDVYIGLDNTEIGELVADTAMKYYQKGGRIAVQERGLRSVLKQRIEGCKRELLQKGYSDVVDILDMTGEELEQKMLLREYIKKADENLPIVLLAFGPNRTIMTAEIIELLGVENNIWFIGFGETEEAIQYVKKGTIDMLYVQDNFEIGKKAIDAVEMLQQKKTREHQNWNVDSLIVTKENCDEFLKGKEGE